MVKVCSSRHIYEALEWRALIVLEREQCLKNGPKLIVKCLDTRAPFASLQPCCHSAQVISLTESKFTGKPSIDNR